MTFRHTGILHFCFGYYLFQPLLLLKQRIFKLLHNYLLLLLNLNLLSACRLLFFSLFFHSTESIALTCFFHSLKMLSSGRVYLHFFFGSFCRCFSSEKCIFAAPKSLCADAFLRQNVSSLLQKASVQMLPSGKMHLRFHKKPLCRYFSPGRCISMIFLQMLFLKIL